MCCGTQYTTFLTGFGTAEARKRTAGEKKSYGPSGPLPEPSKTHDPRLKHGQCLILPPPPRPATPRFLENVVRQALLTSLVKKSSILAISDASVEKWPFGDNAWCSSGVVMKMSRSCWPEHRKVRTSWSEHEKACKCVPSFRKPRDISLKPLCSRTLFPRVRGLFDIPKLIPDSTALNG